MEKTKTNSQPQTKRHWIIISSDPNITTETIFKAIYSHFKGSLEIEELFEENDYEGSANDSDDPMDPSDLNIEESIENLEIKKDFYGSG